MSSREFKWEDPAYKAMWLKYVAGACRAGRQSRSTPMIAYNPRPAPPGWKRREPFSNSISIHARG